MKEIKIALKSLVILAVSQTIGIILIGIVQGGFNPYEFNDLGVFCYVVSTIISITLSILAFTHNWENK